MSKFPPQAEDGDAWTIPLHGAVVPLPASADVPQAKPPAGVPSADVTLPFELQPDEVPSDVGFHPRLRRSA